MKRTLSIKVINLLSLLLLLAGAGLLFYLQHFWPGITLVLGTTLGVRQFLMQRIYDAIASVVTFLMVFITLAFNLFWEVLIPLPSLFLIGALFLLAREFYVIRAQNKVPEEPPPTDPEL